VAPRLAAPRLLESRVPAELPGLLKALLLGAVGVCRAEVWLAAGRVAAWAGAIPEAVGDELGREGVWDALAGAVPAPVVGLVVAAVPLATVVGWLAPELQPRASADCALALEPGAPEERRRL